PGGEEALGLALDALAVVGKDRRVDIRDLVAEVADQAQRTFFRDRLLRKGYRAIAQIAADDLINHAQIQRFLRRDRIVGDDYVQRLLRSDQAGQALRAAGTGDDTQFHFRQADLTALDRHAPVA